MKKIDWLTVVSLTTIAVVLTILFHESIHAFVCVTLGGEIRRFSAVHVNCSCSPQWKFKVVAASGSLANIGIAVILWPLLRSIGNRDGRLIFFVWLVFLVNLLMGTGYWFASGLTNTGDWAGVIRGWRPLWAYQIGLIVLGVVSLMAAVAWSLVEFGRILSRDDEKPIEQAQGIAIVCYVTAFAVMIVVGLAQPGGPFAFPGVAGLVAVLGGLSPLLWMMQWFRADMFQLRGDRGLDIERSSLSIVLAVLSIVAAVALTIAGQR